MAPVFSKIRENQNGVLSLIGVSAAAWIILYGRLSRNKKRFENKYIYDGFFTCEIQKGGKTFLTI